MPLSKSFGNHHKLKALQAVRSKPILGYGLAVFAVGFAILVRWVAGTVLLEGLPFITFYPAILIATFFGGLGPGIAALALSSTAAWFLFLPAIDAVNVHREAFTLVLFVLVGGVNVALIAFLNVALELVLAQEENVRTLLEAAPNGIVVINQSGEITLANAASETLFGYKREELVGRSISRTVPLRATERAAGR
jgi:PAS domain-containing protein